MFYHCAKGIQGFKVNAHVSLARQNTVNAVRMKRSNSEWLGHLIHELKVPIASQIHEATPYRSLIKQTTKILTCHSILQVDLKFNYSQYICK